MELEIDEGAIRAIARKAIARKTGARGLRTIFEKTMMDIMFEIPSREDITKCIITEDTVVNETEPKLVMREPGAHNKKKESEADEGEADA